MVYRLAGNQITLFLFTLAIIIGAAGIMSDQIKFLTNNLHMDFIPTEVGLENSIAILIAAFGIFPILKGALIGTVLLLILKVIKPNEVYQSINWQVIILIAALIPLGLVIRSTGTADWIGLSISKIVSLSSVDWQPYVLLALIYFITMVLTEVSSNAATAIIMTPIVMVVTSQLGMNARPFIFAVCFAASASFITPVGYQTNLMVYGPGGYKFSDYIKVGLPLALTLFVMAVIFIPIFWSF